jgi:hypothetical protein
MLISALLLERLLMLFLGTNVYELQTDFWWSVEP